MLNPSRVALDELVSGRGEAFLEKIIQAAIDLPAPQEYELRALLTQDLDTLLRPTPDDLWDSHAWANLYLGGVRVERRLELPLMSIRTAA